MHAAASARSAPLRPLAAALVLLLHGCAHGGAPTAPAAPPPPRPQAVSPDRGDVDLNITPSRLGYLPAGETAGERSEGPRAAAARRERRAGPKAADTGMLVGVVAGATIGAVAGHGEDRAFTIPIGAVVGIGIGYLVGVVHDAAHGDFQFPVPPLPQTKREYPDP